MALAAERSEHSVVRDTRTIAPLVSCPLLVVLPSENWTGDLCAPLAIPRYAADLCHALRSPNNRASAPNSSLTERKSN